MVGSGVWQDCQSLPTCTLHQWIEPHDGRRMSMPLIPLSPRQCIKHSRILSFVCSSSRIGGAVRPHAGTIVYSFFSHTGFFPTWSHAARREKPSPLSFTFSTQRNRVCFNLYLGFGVNLLSRTGFCVSVTHAASWEPFGYYHPRFFLWRAIFTLRDCV